MGVKHFNGEVDSEYLKESAKLVEKIKEKSYEMMHLKFGMKVLDHPVHSVATRMGIVFKTV